MEMRNLPILIIHQGDNEYIKYSLKQLKFSNPNSDVFLIGTNANKRHCPDNIKHVLIDDFIYSALEFSKIFQQIDKSFSNSNNKKCFIPIDDYNLFCYQRWFILRDFMQANNLSKCCYLDSDCMLYTDINISTYKSLQTNWIGIFNMDELNNFCSFIEKHFSDNYLLEELLKFTIGITHTFVSDMALLWLFNRFPENKFKLGYFNESFFDQNIHDHNIYFTGHFPELEMAEGKKKIYLISNELYCKNLIINQFAKVNSLHFQGYDGKQYLKHFCLPNINIDNSKINYFDYSTCQWIPAVS